MKIKTSELTGAALDWAVAKCEGVSVGNHKQPHGFIETAWDSVTKWENACQIYTPSTSWSQGGSIIEREQIGIDWRVHDTDHWIATSDFWENAYSGPTPLIAAMRCYVASKLGDGVDIPDNLLTVK